MSLTVDLKAHRNRPSPLRRNGSDGGLAGQGGGLRGLWIQQRPDGDACADCECRAKHIAPGEFQRTAAVTAVAWCLRIHSLGCTALTIPIRHGLLLVCDSSALHGVVT